MLNFSASTENNKVDLKDQTKALLTHQVTCGLLVAEHELVVVRHLVHESEQQVQLAAVGGRQQQTADLQRLPNPVPRHRRQQVCAKYVANESRITNRTKWPACSSLRQNNGP